MINEESERVKGKVVEYQRDVSEKVKSFSGGLQRKKAELEKSSTEVKRMVESGNVCDQIKRKESATKELKKKTTVEVGQFKLTVEPALVVKGRYNGSVYL